MSNNWEIIICLAVTLGFSIGGVLYVLYKKYIIQVETSKEIDKLHDTVIPPEVFVLISRLNLSATVRVADDPNAIPDAAVLYRHPSYIIISRLFLDKSQFELRHLLALIAHESGHIKKASKLTWGLVLCASGWLFAVVSLSKSNWAYFLYSLVALIFFTIILIISSWVDEYNADAFAIKDGLIPVEDLAGVLIALKYRFKRNLYKKITHPPVSCRVRRIRRHYDA